MEGVAVEVGVDVEVGIGVEVGVGVYVSIGVGVVIGVDVGASVGVGVLIRVGAGVNVGVGVSGLASFSQPTVKRESRRTMTKSAAIILGSVAFIFFAMGLSPFMKNSYNA